MQLKQIGVKLAYEDVEGMEALIKLGAAVNVSDFTRQAIREKIERSTRGRKR